LSWADIKVLEKVILLWTFSKIMCRLTLPYCVRRYCLVSTWPRYIIKSSRFALTLDRKTNLSVRNFWLILSRSWYVRLINCKVISLWLTHFKGHWPICQLRVITAWTWDIFFQLWSSSTGYAYCRCIFANKITHIIGAWSWCLRVAVETIIDSIVSCRGKFRHSLFGLYIAVIWIIISWPRAAILIQYRCPSLNCNTGRIFSN
jgi:hypothetical protein